MVGSVFDEWSWSSELCSCEAACEVIESGSVVGLAREWS